MNGWRQRWFPSGRGVVSGAGALWRWVIGQAPEQILDWGHEPVPLDDDRFIFHDGDARRGTYLYDFTKPLPDRVSRVSSLELIELAAGAGNWAGVQPGVGIHWSDGHLTVGAGEPFIAADGSVVWRLDDAHREPSCGFGVQAWHDGAGTTVIGANESRYYPNEHRPRIFKTPYGAGLLTMAGNPSTKLRIRPKWHLNEGYERTPGNDANLFADPISHAWGVAEVVYQNTAGVPFLWTQPYSDKPQPFDEPPPPPILHPPVMSEPNYNDRVLALAEQHADLIRINTTETIGRFIEIVAWDLAQRDPRVGHVGKSSGAQYNGHAVNCIAIKLSDTQHRVVQIVWFAEAGNPDAAPADRGKPGIPTWDPKPLETNRSDNPWTPAFAVSSPSQPPDTPPPASGELAALRRQFEAYKQETDVKIAQLEQALRKPIALKSAHGRYVCVEPNGLVIANREQKGAWELFDVER